MIVKIIIDAEMDYHIGEAVNITINYTKYIGKVIAIEHDTDKHLYALELEQEVEWGEL